MRYFSLFFIFVMLSACSTASQNKTNESFAKDLKVIGAKVDSKAYKEALKDYTYILPKYPGKRSEITLKRAVCLVKDQEIEQGLRAMIEAIDLSPKNKRQINVSESYENALELYLSQSSGGPKEIAQKIQEGYLDIYQESKDPSLGYIVAASYALLGDYPTFMDTCYESYSQAPSHYMVHRIRGMIHLKLMKLGNREQKKDQDRALALQAFRKALKQNPKDNALFRMTLLLTNTEEKPELLKENLKLILKADTMLQRIDLFPYVCEALGEGYVDLVDNLITKASKCYESSRSLDAAKKYFEEFQQNQVKVK